MRRVVGVMAVLACTLGLVACSSSSSKSSSAATSSGAKASSVNFTGNFCADGKAASAADIAGASANPSSSDALQRNLDLLKKFKDEAPSEIKSDVATLVDVYGKFVTAMSSAGTDPQKMAAALAPLQGQEAQLQAAAQRVNNYITSHCK
jgi:ABC-type glycerol-3-phosphate transport system substrate-binding protein